MFQTLWQNRAFTGLEEAKGELRQHHYHHMTWRSRQVGEWVEKSSLQAVQTIFAEWAGHKVRKLSLQVASHPHHPSQRGCLPFPIQGPSGHGREAGPIAWAPPSTSFQPRRRRDTLRGHAESTDTYPLPCTRKRVQRRSNPSPSHSGKWHGGKNTSIQTVDPPFTSCVTLGKSQSFLGL